ncbi:probable WRKY transcription factor 75 [Solanum dulcamara]|uniref:probable WRKY transcription factor 75 n=1 Tax=Solanum dulcamara TaxID=45834 RepID=UPI002486C7E4|nr:probable WRKY transcription factor 75 [Solanum dulcamara]
MENYASIFPSSSSSTSHRDEYFSLMNSKSSISDDAKEKLLFQGKNKGFLELMASMETPSGISNKKKDEVKSCKKIKKPRYAFQTRSQVDILDDGYRWRKYGQKAVKNNKFPRSYYRCTHQGCNVKKQVQRLSKDEQVVVTTYEGIHSHPIDKSTDNFEHILSQMQIYTSF